MIHVNKIRRLSKGFTLIELTLSLTFVSVLLLAISMTIIQAGNIYSRGMVMKDINQSARSLMAEIKSDVASAGILSLDEGDYTVTKVSKRVVSGRLCLGNNSYLWNTADAIKGADSTLKLEASPDSMINIIKVPDPEKKYCAKTHTGALLVKNTVAALDVNRVSKLLFDGDHKLSITSFVINTSDTSYDSSTGQRLFSIDFAIGTGAASAMTDSRDSCRPSGEANSDPIYCNVQPFNLVVRTGGGV